MRDELLRANINVDVVHQKNATVDQHFVRIEKSKEILHPAKQLVQVET